MTDIKDSAWYDSMRERVKELLETLVVLEAAFVGYIQIDILEQPVTLSWTSDLVTVTADKYKWQMPIGWFVEDDVVEKIVVPPTTKDFTHATVRTETPAVAAGPSIPATVAPPVDVGDTLVAGGISVPPGVRSVEDIMRDQGLEDADD